MAGMAATVQATATRTRVAKSTRTTSAARPAASDVRDWVRMMMATQAGMNSTDAGSSSPRNRRATTHSRHMTANEASSLACKGGSPPRSRPVVPSASVVSVATTTMIPKTTITAWSTSCGR